MWCYIKIQFKNIIYCWDEVDYDFVKDFKLVYNQAFYTTDIIIINFEEKLIWVLFHEGICWLSKG